MKKWMKIILFCCSSLTLISWDRATKEMAKEHLKDKAAISYFNDVFRLEYVENTGAALSIGDNLSKTVSFWLLSIIPLALLAAASVYVIRNSNKMSWFKLFSFSLIIAGGLGNIFDRMVFDRHVTDFMIISFKSLHTGIFNFADVFVTAGAVMLLVSYRDKKRVDKNIEAD